MSDICTEQHDVGTYVGHSCSSDSSMALGRMPNLPVAFFRPVPSFRHSRSSFVKTFSYFRLDSFIRRQDVVNASKVVRCDMDDFFIGSIASALSKPNDFALLDFLLVCRRTILLFSACGLRAAPPFLRWRRKHFFPFRRFHNK